MNDYSKAKKIVLVQIIVVVVLIILVLFVIIKMDGAKKNKFSVIDMTAKAISSKYANIDYGDEKNLIGNKITSGGIYNLKGEYECIRIDTNSNVKLNLNNATIKCSTGPAILVEDSSVLDIDLFGDNYIKADTNIELDGAIYSKDVLLLSGKGNLSLFSNHDGIVSKDNVIIKGGNYSLETNDDGIRGKDGVSIIDGSYQIKAGGNGIKTTNSDDYSKGNIVIDSGSYEINSVKDSIQADNKLIINDGFFKLKTVGNANKYSSKALRATQLIEILNGNFDVVAVDDGIHSDGNLLIANGEIVVKSNSDAIQAKGILQVDDGHFDIEAVSGLVATNIKYNNGILNVNASEYGIIASNSDNKYNIGIGIAGGYVQLNMGKGDTCAIVSDEYIYILGGLIEIEADSAFRYYGDTKYKNGKVLLNGKELEKLPEMEKIVRQDPPEGQVPPNQQPPSMPGR